MLDIYRKRDNDNTCPILLGEGKPLFGKTDQAIKLEHAEAKAYPNDFIQVRYKVSYI